MSLAILVLVSLCLFRFHKEYHRTDSLEQHDKRLDSRSGYRGSKCVQNSSSKRGRLILRIHKLSKAILTQKNDTVHHLRGSVLLELLAHFPSLGNGSDA